MKKNTQRKARMGIVTNKMSDEVYNKLDEKARNNELSQYIIQLVEKDLQDEFLKEQASFIKDKMNQFDSELTSFHNTLARMTHLLHKSEASPMNQIDNNETLVNLEFVSDDEVSNIGFDEDIDLNF